MPENFVAIVFPGLAVVYLLLYARDYLRQGGSGGPARKAWLRVGLFFGAMSAVLFYLDY